MPAPMSVPVQSFNPTLVRLRLGHNHFGGVISLTFQSHAGSIEAITIILKILKYDAVSIPRWFD